MLAYALRAPPSIVSGRHIFEEDEGDQDERLRTGVFALSRAQTALKRLFVGRPMASGELEHTYLPKVIALPVFSSDALSSVAYAVQEQLLVLAAVGVAALQLTVPVSATIALLFAVVVLSYQQIVKAYPSGGGSYIVARENLGNTAGLLVGAALIIDYTMTVAVSITAGVDAIVSAAIALMPFRVALVVALIALVMLVNLRGVRESGAFFSIPTYAFILSIAGLIGFGLFRCLGGCPAAPTASTHLPVLGSLTILVLMRTFAAGTTALTGIEAIADSVPSFRPPQSKNAARTLALLGVIAIVMLLGVAWLAVHTGVVFTPGAERTALAQIALAVFGEGPMFYVLQVTTAAILVLAANTAFNGFPVLMSILARDRIMPRHFLNRGDRLVLSNGVVILAFFASIVVVAFKAELTHLLQLYLLGVFISFTLAQAGTALRWNKIRDPGWQRRAAINSFGAVMTGVVLVIVLITKFLLGAWIVVILTPILMYAMHSIYVHLNDVKDQLAEPQRRPSDRRPGNQHMVILVNQVDAAAARAVGYGRAARIAELTAVTFDESSAEAWKELAPDIPLRHLSRDGQSKADALKRHLGEMRGAMSEDDFLTVVVPEVLKKVGLGEILGHPGLHRLKASLLTEPNVQVLDVPILESEIDPEVDESREPARNYVVVLVGAVHNALLQAIEYAETLNATSIRGLYFGLESEGGEQVGDAWLEARIPHPLQIQDSPFRDIGHSVRDYVEGLRPDGVNRVVTVVLPEFVVPKRRHQILHGQTALIVKRHLLFAKGVVVVSVPYHLEDSGEEADETEDRGR
ncbi:APC family permease [soil metagenome]